MIGALEGSIIHKKNNSFIVMVAGVGYVVSVTAKLFEKIHLTDTVRLYVYTHVREDSLDLFGFETTAELSVFELLLSVSGVGPKTALGILDRGANELLQAVTESNVDFFKGIARVGTKNAQKI